MAGNRGRRRRLDIYLEGLHDRGRRAMLQRRVDLRAEPKHALDLRQKELMCVRVRVRARACAYVSACAR